MIPKISLDNLRLILGSMYDMLMEQQNQNNSQVVKMAIIGAIATLALLNVSVAMAKSYELINTATNEIASPQDMGKRDILEEIYADLDEKSHETQSTFIVVEQEDGSVTLFNIDYPYEDYEETDLPMKEVGNYDDLEELAK